MMKRYFLILFLLISTFPLSMLGQRRHQHYIDYIEKYNKEAVEQMHRYRIPASITLERVGVHLRASRTIISVSSVEMIGVAKRLITMMMHVVNVSVSIRMHVKVTRIIPVSWQENNDMLRFLV